MKNSVLGVVNRVNSRQPESLVSIEVHEDTLRLLQAVADLAGGDVEDAVRRLVARSKIDATYQIELTADDTFALQYLELMGNKAAAWILASYSQEFTDTGRLSVMAIWAAVTAPDAPEFLRVIPVGLRAKLVRLGTWPEAAPEPVTATKGKAADSRPRKGERAA